MKYCFYSILQTYIYIYTLNYREKIFLKNVFMIVELVQFDTSWRKKTRLLLNERLSLLIIPVTRPQIVHSVSASHYQRHCVPLTRTRSQAYFWQVSVKYLGPRPVICTHIRLLSTVVCLRDCRLKLILNDISYDVTSCIKFFDVIIDENIEHYPDR